ncbi:MAG TPA: hypothetical protein VEA44_07225 [Caulobacter sp.]|nr:hypothetical protein [Caulobacter sp.]
MTTTLKTPDLDTAEKAMRLPVGVSSPLWLMIGSAAMVGAAMFWATRWLKPVNLEAELPQPAPISPDSTASEAAVEPLADAAAEAARTSPVETAYEAPGEAELAEVRQAAGEEPGAEVVIDPVVEAPVLAPRLADPVGAAEAADDLTVMAGIGPKLAAALASRGVTRFEQIAGWTEADIARFDRDMKLMGRIVREGWVEQARRLAGG